jgi:hypothetical protein
MGERSPAPRAPAAALAVFEGAVREDAGREDAAREDAAREDAAREDAAREDGGREDGGREDVAREDAGREDAAREDVVVVDPGVALSPRLGAASRCFLLEPIVAQDAVATAISGSPALRLRQTLFALDEGDALTRARALDGRGGERGWSCPEGGPAGGRLILSWSWTTPTQRLTDAGGRGVGLALPAKPLVLHARADLLALGLGAEVRPRLELSLGSAAAGHLVELRAAPRAAAPGRRRVEIEVDWPAPGPLRLLGVVPRMGSHGKMLEVAVLSGAVLSGAVLSGAGGEAGARRCAAWFGHWRATQEQLYRRERPIDLRRGDVVRLTCTVTTLAREGLAAVEVGGDEESACAAALYLAAPE